MERKKVLIKRNLLKFLSFIMSTFMAISIFANVTIVKATEDTVTSINLAISGGFEDTTVNNGMGNCIQNGSAVLQVTDKEASSGTHSLKVTNTQNNWDGPAYDLKNLVQLGHTYNVSFKAKAVAGQLQAGAVTSERLNVQLHKDPLPAGETNAYPAIVWQKAITEDSWTPITTQFTVTGTTAYTTLLLYIGTPDKGLQFYVDDVVITDPAGGTVTPPDGTNLMPNGSFENGIIGWYARQASGGTLVVEDTTETAATGTHSLKVTGRQESWNGPAYSVKNIMQNGRSYNISMKVKAVAGQAEQGLAEKVKLSIERQIDESPTYTNVSSETDINETTWTTVSGECSLNYTGNLNLLDIYVESSIANLAFFVDDVVITDTTPVITGNVITNSTFENGTAGWSTSGNPAIASSNEVAHSGSYSLKVTNRTENYMGPSYDLSGKIVAGKSYNVDFWAMYNTGDNATEQIKATVKVGSGDAAQYNTVVQPVTLTKGQWTKLTGSFAAPTNANTAVSIYIEATSATLSFYVDDFTVVGELPVKPLEIQQDIPSLAATLEDYFQVGGAVNPGDFGSNSLTEQLVKKHYNVITAENAMKPDATQKTEGVFTFDQADKLVDFAKANNMEMRGHTLVWHSQVPDWFFQDPADPTKLASKELLLQRERTHIRTVLNHYKTKYGTAAAGSPIKYWDVVNEVIDDQGNYRNSKWYQIACLDYIKVAFETAREVDPSLNLYINDYNTERNNAKTRKLYELVKDFREQGVPIDGIGLQMHLTSDVSLDDVKASIELYESLGVDLQITELDVRMGVENENVTSEVLLQQARYYKQLFDVLKAHSDSINTVIFWGVIDDTSWYKTSKPLLFDGKFQAKPAFYAIADPEHATVNVQSIQATQGSLVNEADVAWTTVKSISANNFVSGLDGATAKVQTMWDANNLYVKVYVSDSTLGNNDSIEIFVDKKNDNSTAYETDDNHKHLIIKRNEVKNDANGYAVYATIPVNDIAPVLNTVVGFDIRVNDDKASGNVDSIAVFNDYANRQDTNAAFFADLKFAGPSKLAKAAYGTPVIDGTKDDIWNSSDEINTNVWVAGTSGATAKARAMWDEHNLYIIAEVADDVLNKASANVWEQDSVEVFVDQNNAKTTSYQNDDYQLRVNFGNEQSFGGGGVKPVGFQSATTKTTDGYIVEEVIPLTAVTPEFGKILGFDIQVNNAGASGSRTSVATWCDPSGNGYQNTSGFGNLLLAKVDYDRLIELTKLFTNKNNPSLISKLQQAKAAEAKGNLKQKDAMIKTYISEVNAQRGKMIDEDNADLLVKFAEEL